MPGRNITDIVIHCSASPNGVSLARDGHGAAETIDEWHRLRGFRRAAWRLRLHPGHGHIGYHRVIDVDGKRESGRDLDEVGAHVLGHNATSIGICLVGTDRYTLAQWRELGSLVDELLALWPRARVCGHRDFSPDRNGDGRITRNEWIKVCPGFDVATWRKGGWRAVPDHVFDPPTEGATP